METGRLLSQRDVRALLGVSETTLWRYRQQKGFPAPLPKFGRLKWWEADVRAWADGQDRRAA